MMYKSNNIPHNDESIFKSVDWITVLIYVILVFCGWVSIYGASYEYEHAVSMYDLSGRAGMQLVWIGSSLIIGFVLLKLDSSLYDILAYYIYAALILLLIITIVVAPDIKGSRSWLVITNSIRIQPAEFAKFGVALALAKYMSSYNFKLMVPKSIVTVISILVVPFILIILQNETGSALVYSAFILMLYREGLPGLVLVLGATAVVLFVFGLKYSEIDFGYYISKGEFISIMVILSLSIILIMNYAKDIKTALNIGLGAALLLGGAYLVDTYYTSISWGLIGIIALASLIVYLTIIAIKRWNKTYIFIALFGIASIFYVNSIDYFFTDVLQPHQQLRIKVTLGMTEDPLGVEYNVNQSKIAIGSGGLLGKGFLNGTQTKLKYVPEQDTDFIFCTVGEEQGFAGSVFVLILFGILIVRLMLLAEQQKTHFSRIYGYSVASILFFHVAINVGMVIGLTPVIGIPLPFFSYGGSSLWGFTILLFIFLRLDMARKRR